MIASDHDGRLDAAVRHQFVNLESEPGPLAVSEPADARRQSLEMYPLLSQADPARQAGIFRKQAQDQFVGRGDIRGLTR